MASKPKVYFFFDKISISLRNRIKLKEVIGTIFADNRKHLEQVTYIFCGDKDLLNINRQYLKADYYTDIITFDLSEQKNSITGEIYISIDRIRDNAKELKIPIQTELRRVIFHGALHLCGYNDKTKRENSLMRTKEDYYISLM